MEVGRQDTLVHRDRRNRILEQQVVRETRHDDDILVATRGRSPTVVRCSSTT